jgi:alginate O-acetyltransferase complex protein AlgI
MVFSSIEFALLFVATVAAYLLTRQKYRWIVLLSASLVFYAGLHALYLPATLVVIAMIAYLFGNWIQRAREAGRKRALLWLGILLILAIFAGLRYFSFLYRTFFAPWRTVDVVGQTALVTVGVSFIAFQAVSYLIDIYREVTVHESHIGYLVLYLAYFPKLLQGPLEHAGTIIPQLKATRINSYENVRSGILLFAWGLCKKLIIADRMAVIANQVFGNVAYYHGISLVVAIYAFAVQIYADFSGYTDMAIGISRIFSISLTDNFNQPYFSTSFADFWRRWHISFMNWLREYIFMPLQIIWRKQRTLGSIAAILVVFGVSGLWHGIGYTYIIWGLVNGLFVAGGLLFEELRRKRKWKKHDNALKNLVKIVVVFNLTCFTWIFFRSASIHDALHVLGNMAVGVPAQISSLGAFERAILVGMKRSQAALTAVLLIIFFTIEVILHRKRCKFDQLVLEKYPKLRWPIYCSMIAGIILLSFESGGSFIYFSF